ncbi:MAG: hypothetical protein LBT67_01240 [Holosporaceae bacterium]|nr:hypothetical protein [Holosporaceae bacterium]
MKKLALISAAICAFGSYVSTAEASTDVNLKLSVIGEVTLDVTPEGSTLEMQAIPDADGTYKTEDLSYTNSEYQGIRLKANRDLENYRFAVEGQNDAGSVANFRLKNTGANDDGDYVGPQFITYRLKLGENLILNRNNLGNDPITVAKDSNMDFSIDFPWGLGELVVGEQYRDTLTFTFIAPPA